MNNPEMHENAKSRYQQGAETLVAEFLKGSDKAKEMLSNLQGKLFQDKQKNSSSSLLSNFYQKASEVYTNAYNNLVAEKSNLEKNQRSVKSLMNSLSKVLAKQEEQDKSLRARLASVKNWMKKENTPKEASLEGLTQEIAKLFALKKQMEESQVNNRNVLGMLKGAYSKVSDVYCSAQKAFFREKTTMEKLQERAKSMQKTVSNMLPKSRKKRFKIF